MATIKRQKKSSLAWIRREAKRLISESTFLYKAGRAIRDLGVIGERRLRVIVFLAGVTRNLPEKASVLVKGASASGKSTTVRTALLLFPPKCILYRTDLSKTALAYGLGYLGDKILLMTELTSAKQAQFFIRQMQSEGHIEHEATNVRGPKRNTKTVKRKGTPVVITTTTHDKVLEDDETRFLSAHVTETPEQTLRIVKAQAKSIQAPKGVNLELWRTATAMLCPQPGDFEHPPDWINYVAEHLPTDEIRLRRDWTRFLAFLRAIALCHPRPKDGRPLDICFRDYCVAYTIFEPVLYANITEAPAEDLQLSRAVAALAKRKKRAVKIKELLKYLNWNHSMVYKHIKSAVRNRLVKYEPGTREKNEKRLLARAETTKGFLPTPTAVLQNNPNIGKKVKYVHPFTGKWKTVRR